MNKEEVELTQENNQEPAEADYSYLAGLSLEDVKTIQEEAILKTENHTGEPFDMGNLSHREYFQFFKQEILKEKEKEIKLREFEKNLQEKYGEMFPEIEKQARCAFENMAYKDARHIILCRLHGDIESLLTFYDNIYKEMEENKERSKKDKNILFPPETLGGGNFENESEKKAEYENYI